MKSAVQTANAVLAFLRRSHRSGQAEVFLISNAEMRILNRTFRHKDKATNVLAFPADGFARPDLPGGFLGEVYVAPDYINAHRQDLTKLIIHGLLHLFGYDHKKKNDRIRMELLEEKIFRRLTE